MRVIAGILSGRVLRTPRAPEFRPTEDRVREAYFSILGESVREGPYLDLFAGCGSVGIEAWSRGAPRVAFVERDTGALAALEQNFDGLAIGERVEVIREDVIRALRGLAHRPMRWGNIFADPPYGYPRYPRLLRAVAESRILEPGGIFALEHSSRIPLPDPPEGLRLTRLARYGESSVAFYALIGTGTPTSEERSPETDPDDPSR